jgi:hypothetical protein
LARRDIEKFQEGPADHHSSTYIDHAVGDEYGVMDLHIGTISINSSALEVVCSPPGIGAKISDSPFGRKCSDGAGK